MTATITPVAMPANSPPRVQLTVAGVTTGAGTCTIQRTDLSGQQNNVRGAEPMTLSGGGGVAFDFEIPYNKAATYAVIDSLGAIVATSSATTLTVSQAWLIHPAVPSLSVPLYGVMFDDADLPTGIVMQPIPGRADSIPIGDGARKKVQSVMTMRTKDAAGTSGMDSILAGTATLLVQLVYPGTTVSDWFYLAPLDLKRARTSKLYSDQRRIYTLNYEAVIRPSGTITAQWQWANVIANYATWQDVLNHYHTWTGVISGIEGT